MESALRGLKPSAPALDRDRLMFRAGQAARAARGWQLSLLTAAVGLLVGTAGTWLTLRTALQPEVQVQYVHVPVPAPAPAPEEKPKTPEAPKSQDPPAVPQLRPAEHASAPAWSLFSVFAQPSGGYLHLRDQVVRLGVDVMTPLPGSATSASPTGEPTSVFKMQQDWLDNLN